MWRHAPLMLAQFTPRTQVAAERCKSHVRIYRRACHGNRIRLFTDFNMADFIIKDYPLYCVRKEQLRDKAIHKILYPSETFA